MGNDKILLRNIGIAATVVIASIAFFSVIGDTGKDSCQEVFESFTKRMEAVCPAEYLEWGYDSPKQCVSNEMALFDPIECE